MNWLLFLNRKFNISSKIWRALRINNPVIRGIIAPIVSVVSFIILWIVLGVLQFSDSTRGVVSVFFTVGLTVMLIPYKNLL
ncbi:MAG: hypothetical protein FWH55_04120 [Oscillospiraceae bacterium]|nr:hypothetical protein [Oscillospiraceae bacterium]